MLSDLERLRKGLARALEEAGPPPGERFPCPYLPGLTARHLTIVPRPLAPGVYHALMDLNFRRVGDVFYRPECDACDECRVVRIPVAEFQPTRAQRRCRARNADVTLCFGAPCPSEEKYALYCRYLEGRHEGPMDGSREEFERFLCTSAVDTLEVVYRVAGKLLAVGIFDVEPQALSAVYCYYDASRAGRSPGVFNVLSLVDECRRRGIPHLYLGYFIRDCRRMSYKAGFKPCEALSRDGRFVRLTAPAAVASLNAP
jgi:arginine-tRNA-protein transferase